MVWTPTHSGRNAARRNAANLVRRGFLDRERMLLEPELELEAPVHVWEPGALTPNSWQIAHRLQERWGEHARIAVVHFASWKTARMFGGYGGGIRNPLQVTHDLHLSGVYLHYRSHRPEQAGQWVSEDHGEHSWGEKVPDARIVDGRGETLKVVEFGGKYDGRRVEKFHHYCAERRLPYEIW